MGLRERRRRSPSYHVESQRMTRLRPTPYLHSSVVFRSLVWPVGEKEGDLVLEPVDVMLVFQRGVFPYESTENATVSYNQKGFKLRSILLLKLIISFLGIYLNTFWPAIRPVPRLWNTGLATFVGPDIIAPDLEV